MEQHASSVFVSVPEFAARTSLSVRQVWRLISNHGLPTLRVGRRRLVRLSEAIDALESLDGTQNEKGGSK